MIGGSAFESCQLNSVTLSPVLESIGLAAFSGNKLTEITIPDSVKTIEQQAFVGNKLTKVVIAGSGEAHLTLGNGVFQRTGVGQNEIVDITLPDNVVIPNDVPWAPTVPPSRISMRTQVATTRLAGGLFTIPTQRPAPKISKTPPRMLPGRHYGGLWPLFLC